MEVGPNSENKFGNIFILFLVFVALTKAKKVYSWGDQTGKKKFNLIISLILHQIKSFIILTILSLRQSV